MNTNYSKFSTNNFDLIRLFAAAQVAHYHIFHFINVDLHPWHEKLIEYWGIFPGVPIFFFISGFLISRSWEKTANLKIYITNRVLRIYPALIAAVTLSFILINVSGYVNYSNPEIKDLILLFFAKTSILQFYNPEFMRQYGDGVMNGSLWTITVELQFYIITPLIYFIFKKINVINFSKFTTILIILFLTINIIFSNYLLEYKNFISYKILRVSFAPWIYMFLVGVLFQQNFEKIHTILKGKFAHCLIIYILLALVFRNHGANFGNSLNPIMFAALSALIFSTAYSNINLSKILLKKTDISYGIYIYHMPIVNYILYTNKFTGYTSATIAISTVTCISITSWFLLEKNALRFKPKSINSDLTTKNVNKIITCNIEKHRI